MPTHPSPLPPAPVAGVIAVIERIATRAAGPDAPQLGPAFQRARIAMAVSPNGPVVCDEERRLIEALEDTAVGIVATIARIESARTE